MLNVPFHERGRLCDEYIAAMIELWTSEAPQIRGQVRVFQGRGVRPEAAAKAAACRCGAAATPTTC